MFDCGGFCLWGQVGIQVVAAAFVVIPILAALGKERDRARSTTQFAIDQFDATIGWAVGHLELKQPIPAEVSQLLVEYFRQLRAGLAADSLRLHRALPVEQGRGWTAEDPWKLLHLTCAYVEAGIGRSPIDRNLLLAGHALSAYLSLLLGAGDQGSHRERMQTIQLMLKQSPRGEAAEIIASLVGAGPKHLASGIADS